MHSATITGMYIFRFAIILGLFFIPALTFAQVFMTEIMYDLEGSDSGREWIEILNSAGEAVDFSTWRLHEASTNHKLTLFSGDVFVPDGEYAIIADNPEKFLLDWPQFSGILFDSSFSLHNTGETLILRNEALEDIDTVSYLSESGATGDGNSLQKINGSWVAAVPTPGFANADEQNNESDSDPTPTPAEVSSTDTYVSEPKKTITADAGPAKQTTLAGANTVFSGSVYGLKGELVSDARYVWSFGDGSMQEGKSVAHTYVYPGEYVVVLEGSSGGHAAGDKMLVTVVPADVSINSVGASDDFFISLKNDTKQEINLEGWVLRSGSFHFMIPANTHIISGKTVKFSPQITKLLYSSNVSLLFPNGRIASVYTPHNQVVSTPTPAPVVSPNIQKVNSVVTEAEPILPESLQGVEEVSMAATVGETNTGASIMYWLFALIGVLAVAFGAFYFIFQNNPAPEHADISVADTFTIIEEK